jgi:hypothetical protein
MNALPNQFEAKLLSFICLLKTTNGLSNVIVDFPVDRDTGFVESFFEGESSSFIQAFNAYGTQQVN